MSEDLSPSPSSEYAGLVEQNGWLVEEKYQQFLVNPQAVDESWRALFSNGWDSRTMSARRASTAVTEKPAPAAPPAVALPSAPPTNGAATNGAATNGAATNGVVTNGVVTSGVASNGSSAHTNGTNGAASTVPKSDPTPVVSAPQSQRETATPLRGAPAALAKNMIESLGVPTATSVHPLPAAVLEANRNVINDHLARTGGKKVSFTHIIAAAIVRGLRTVPVLNSSYVTDANGSGAPGVIHHEHLGLGLAIDLERKDGTRSLVVAAIHEADTLDFVGLVEAYDDIVVRAREGKLGAADFSGVTVSITNPGGLGTTQSVPRLMTGQGAIIGVGAIDYPVEFAATDRATLSELGIGKVLTLTSTYDHRIIQGAESGLFLKYVHELLVGEHHFYEELFDSIGLSTPPVRLGRDSGRAPERSSGIVDARVTSLVDAYRTRGHLSAWLNPLASTAPEVPTDLDPTTHGFSVFDFDRTFATGGFGGKAEMTVGELVGLLRATYCATIGVEYRHIQEPAERAFFEDRLERPYPGRTPEAQRRTLNYLERAETFERFLQQRYVGVKRFGLEGGESAAAFLDATFDQATADGTTQVLLGMAHRGRLNTLVNIVGKPLSAIFSEFEDTLDPTTIEGSGDVKYHKGGHGTWTGLSGRTLEMSLAANPSHLETVDPVVEGMTRARQDRIGALGEQQVMPILIHGDASTPGQGVVAETLNLSLIPAYRTGGTIHLIINNQIGFTTYSTSGRSTRYASDVAKMIEAPVLHVNGDDPDAVARCGQIAAAYRAEFGKDVVVDLVCYRLLGHNEGDDPTYTQPVMYQTIAAHDSTRTIYAAKLIDAGVVTLDETTASIAAITAELSAALTAIRDEHHEHLETLPEKPYRPMAPLTTADGVARERLDAIVHFLHAAPDGFHIHPKIERQLAQRMEQYESGEVDWAHGEALAYATLSLDGVPIRLIGQDTQRGTFAHRQSTFSDIETAEHYTPLEALSEGKADGLVPVSPAPMRIWDSALTEYAGLGFEYGYSIGSPETLVLWEAQFGDFANGAQIILDNYISSSEEKWNQRSGIVLLLPHGYEGQGPEHSSARIERFLQLSSGENITVVQPTTASQFFHLIRTHAHLAERRPLVVITPKSLLRARLSRSKVDELVSGSFRTVIDDAPAGSVDHVRRVVLGSGRIIDDLIKRRNAVEQSAGAPIAILRVEQLSPWPTSDITAALAKYPRAEEVIWAQDEPENMGALTYAVPRLQASVGSAAQIFTVSRRVAGSPATGSHQLHDVEIASILDRAIGPVPA